MNEEDIYSLHLEDNDVEIAPTKLRKHHAIRISDVLDYVRFIQDNGDYTLANNPYKWDIKDLRKWKRDDKPKSNPIATPTVGTAAKTSPTIAPLVNKDIVLNKEGETPEVQIN